VKLGEVEMGRGMKILDVLLPGDYFYSRPDSEKARYEALCGGVVISRCSVGLLKHFAIVRPEIGLMLHALTIRTLERLERQISIFVCKTPQAQLTAFFQTIFRRSRFRKKSSTASPISRADIGQYLGVPEQVLEECLSQLSTQGVVRLTGRGVIYIKNDCEL
jgi:CRP-like cAMP-binding protein